MLSKEMAAKYENLHANIVKIDGVEYLAKVPGEEGGEGMTKREAISICKVDNLIYVNVRPSLLSSNLKTGASPYSLLKSSVSPCDTLLRILDQITS